MQKQSAAKTKSRRPVRHDLFGRENGQKSGRTVRHDLFGRENGQKSGRMIREAVQLYKGLLSA